MYREIIQELIRWKDKRRRKPLILTGVRQCGKTYIIKEYGNSHFKNMVHLNFEESENAGAIFDYDFDVERIITEIGYLTGETIVPGETLLFLDEIQNCPKAITALKYFCENKRELHVICAGSLLGVAIKRDQMSFPVGKVNRLQLYPMSFKEFVIACGHTDLVEILSKWPTDRAVPDLYATPMKKLLKEYYIIGGMPEAVQTWLDTHDYNEVTDVHMEILRDYADDFSKYAPANEVPKIRWIWDSIPVQLAKENNKFVFSHVRAGKRSAQLEDALQWLKDAGLITQLFLVEKPELPLSGFADKTYFKVYMSDIGLLRTKAGMSPETVFGETGMYIRFKGGFAENYVLNELCSMGKDPYFWRSGNSAEIDFIYEDQSYMIPVEVKSADNSQAKSYRQFCKRYDPVFGFKLSEKNIAENMCESTRTFSIPLYMIWGIKNYYCNTEGGKLQNSVDSIL